LTRSKSIKIDVVADFSLPLWGKSSAYEALVQHNEGSQRNV
jgi:hypothetical protein